MRAWEIKNWNCGAKLRRKDWIQNKHIFIQNDMWIYKNGSIIEPALEALAQVMNSNDVEEYIDLPTKTKDLTWQEAYEAWNDGWEIVLSTTGTKVENWGYALNFSSECRWSVKDILNGKYQLTGKRR